MALVDAASGPMSALERELNAIAAEASW